MIKRIEETNDMYVYEYSSSVEWFDWTLRG